MVLSTLKIKNLPSELSDDEKRDFLEHFGAREVKIITSKANYKERCIVYAKFASEEIAKAVLIRLHQLKVLNCRLCVEFVDQEIGFDLPKISGTNENLDSNLNSKRHFKVFINRLNAFNANVSFNQPPPSHLKYVYPKPNRATINNIAHALASIPKFYTQVLHLMNRMNLPPPFSDIPDPPTCLPVQETSLKPHKQQEINEEMKSKMQESEEEESEIESDNEGNNVKEIIPQKRHLPQKSKSTMIKRPKFINPLQQQQQQQIQQKQKEDGKANKEKIMQTDVFESIGGPSNSNNKQIGITANILVNKKIELTLKPTTITRLNNEEQHKEKQEIITKEEPMNNCESKNENGNKKMTENVINLNEVVAAKEDQQEQEQELIKVISDEELAENRIELKDLNVLPVFKNYHPGIPTSRLYIKNIAKTVETKDLEYIYNRYKKCNNKSKDGGESQETSQFNIRLMQEGRMKGQAFVTLDSIELAQLALKETNGFILKERPIVVVFAKSAAAASTTNSNSNTNSASSSSSSNPNTKSK